MTAAATTVFLPSSDPAPTPAGKRPRPNRPFPTGRAKRAPQKPLTYDEFLDWLDEDTHAEWVNGKIIMHSPVSARHQRLLRFLVRLLSEFLERGALGGDLMLDPFQMKIGPDFPGRAPDILYVAQENLHRLKPNLLEGPADLVVEIVSPGTRGIDRGDKHFEYERGGVREYWLLDPERTLAEFHRLGTDSRYHLAAPDAQNRFFSDVLPGFWLHVDWLWQDPLPTVRDVLRAWDEAAHAK